MKEVIERCYCDVCESKEREAHTYKTLAYRTFDSEDGTEIYNEPKFETVELDLCNECAAKITALHEIGVCCEKYEILPVKECSTAKKA